MKVTLSQRALADIEAISDHIAIDSRSAAGRLSQQLLDACEDLALLPERYQTVDEWAGWSVRRRPYRSYSIYYVVRERDALILRVAHGSQDYSRLFDG